MEISKTIWFDNGFGRFKLTGYCQTDKQCLLIQSEKPLPETPIIRMHSSCVTSEVLGMKDCDCTVQLMTAFEMIAKTGGLILYSEAEGRGAGIFPKINALFEEAATGIDSFSAYEKFGLKPDYRDYSLEAEILKSMDIRSIRLLTNNTDKVRQLEESGIQVSQV